MLMTSGKTSDLEIANRQAEGSPKKISAELSKGIVSLRFLLIVMVVFIHSNLSEVNLASGTVSFDIPWYADIIRKLIS